MPRPTACLCLVLALLGACSPSEPTGPHIVQFTPPDVSQPRDTFRHRESGLVFTTPGPGWRLLPLAEAVQVDPSALLSFVNPDGTCRGWATVTEAPPALGPPEAARYAADLARTSTMLESAAVHVDEYVLYDLWTARRWELQGRRAGETTSIRATFFVDKGRLFRVQAEAKGPLYGERRHCLDAVTAGFTFAQPVPTPALDPR